VREMKILVCNSGSSSLKVSLFDTDEERLLADGSIDWLTVPGRLTFHRPGCPELREEVPLREHAGALERILQDLLAGPDPALRSPDEIDAIAHRVVHGGPEHTSPVFITPEEERTI